MSEPRDATRICRDAIRDGATREEVVAELHAQGVYIIAAIKAVRAAFSISLGEAKQLVTAHPAWRAEVDANQPLHDELESALTQDLAAASPRKPWIALLLGLLCNGLGHAYAGRVRAGLAIYAVWLAMQVGFVVALRIDLRAAVAAGTALLTFWLAQALRGARAARVARAQRPWYSRPLGLAGLFVASVVLSYAVRIPLADYVPRAFYQTSSSMEPTLRVGDLILAEGPVAAERGAVVVHRPPAGARSPDPLVKRVVALEGDVVEVRDGRLLLNGAPVSREPVPGRCTYWTRAPSGPWREEPCLEFVDKVGEASHHTYCTPLLPCGDVPAATVPPGHVFVLGDHRDHSADSRVYGPVAVDAILGRVAYIYFSFGPSGVRWERIGKLVE